MRKPNKLYEHLKISGILTTGTPEEIQRVKQEYWKQHRKQWRKEQRATCISCTIFFTPSDMKILNNVFKGEKRNVAGFVKLAALNAAQNKANINKEIVGKIREAFFETFVLIEAIQPDKGISDLFLDLEQKIITLIK